MARALLEGILSSRQGHCMQNYLSRLIGGLSVGRKLALIYFLDLTAVIFVSGILINEKYIAIHFTDKEIAGAHYIAAVSRSLVPLAQAEEAPSSAATAATMSRLADARSRYSALFGADDLAQAYSQALAAHTGDQAFDAGRALITRIGNQSNLILDPDLDSYYTMSLVMLRFPELLGL
ncbi:MAG TPA: hypothetical protein VF797_08785, partial [Noviherbaspirillum sp.]